MDGINVDCCEPDRAFRLRVRELRREMARNYLNTAERWREIGAVALANGDINQAIYAAMRCRANLAWAKEEKDAVTAHN